MQVKLALAFVAAVALTLLAGVAPGLSASDPASEEAQKLRVLLDAPIPDPKEHNPVQLAQIYLQRARAAQALGESERALKEFLAGIQVVGLKSPAAYDLYDHLAPLYLDRGDPERSVEARKSALAVTQNPVRQLTQIAYIATVLSGQGKREEAKQYLDRAEATLVSVRNNERLVSYGSLMTAKVAQAKGYFDLFFGYLKDAEEDYRLCLGSIRTYMGKDPDAFDRNFFDLANCTKLWMFTAVRQGRLREASVFVDDARRTAQDYAVKQGRPLFVSRMAPEIARVYIEEGLLKEASDLLEATVANVTKAVESEEESGEANQIVRARRQQAAMEMMQGNWQKAEEIYRQTKEPVAEWGYALVKLGRVNESLQMLNTILQNDTKRYDDKSLYLWEDRAFYALASGASGQKEAAVKTLSSAIPKILEMSRPEGTSGEAGLFNTARLDWLLDGYIMLLTDVHRAGGRVEGVDIVSEAFRYADIARGSRVQGALSAAILRASVSDPTVAAVVRKSQDLEYQLKVTAESLTVLQNDDKNPEKEKLIAAARANLERLRAENEETQKEPKRKLPDYSDLLNPKPLDIAGTQKFLHPNEALISIYSTPQRALVWAVPAQGQPSFSVLDLPSSGIADLVAKLRKSLDPTEVDVSGVPTFDFDTAYDLYQRLLAPVENGWKDAQELLIVPHGALSELPFSVLITGTYKPAHSAVPFADHAAAPWLLQKAAISYLPTVAGLASLRRATTQTAERAFIGFGDPVFAAASTSDSTGASLASRGIQRRNLKVPTRSISATENQGQLGLLQPLPDTSREVQEIAKILHADEGRDVYLGRRASEQVVKATDLTRYRVVMFATHGLVPGDLPDLSQPALALSNPALTGEKEDGLLTLTEILALKLRADWVVLSACNTASPDGQASEAVSGLGRAFFYAGAKALLVSHWPVETVSARLLTTELFKRQAGNPKLGRAQAMREASLALMQQSAKVERGQPYSYAHPMFWAPFVVVGDGG